MWNRDNIHYNITIPRHGDTKQHLYPTQQHDISEVDKDPPLPTGWAMDIVNDKKGKSYEYRELINRDKYAEKMEAVIL